MKVFDSRGNLIAQGAELVSPPGEFRSFDFNRDTLPLPGEPGTGRLQLRTVLEVHFQRTNLVKFTVEIAPLEVIDNRTGKTVVLVSQKPKETVVVGSK